MLRKDKKNGNYILVEYTDILMGLNYATKMNDSKIDSLLSNLFVDADNFDTYIDNKR